MVLIFFRSVAGFIYLLYLSWSIRYDLEIGLDTLKTICRAYNDNETKHKHPMLFKIHGTEISTKVIREFLTSLRNGNNLLKALQDTFGIGKHFRDHLKISENKVIIQVSGDNYLRIPWYFPSLENYYSTLHRRITHELRKDEGLLRKALAQHKNTANTCRKVGDQPFFRSWNDSKAKVRAARRLLRGILKRDEGRVKIIRKELIQEYKAILSQVELMTDKVMGLKEKLQEACQGQLKAINSLERNRRTNPGQPFREAAFGAKAQRLIPSIFDGSFFVRPLDRCHQNGCNTLPQHNHIISRGGYFIFVALIAAIITALYLTRFLRTILRGIMCCCPCFEIFNC